MVDDRLKAFLDLFTGKEKPENLVSLKKLPFFANDICFFTGIYYEMKKNKAKAFEYYKEGIKVSYGCDFPWYELEAGKKRTEK